MLGFSPLAKLTLADAPTRKTLVASSGSYTLTGTAATLQHGWVTTAAAGSYSLTGATAGLKHGWTITASAGSYTLTGTAATLRHGWVLSASAGSYSLTGAAATLKHGWLLTASAGSYSLTGTNATLRHGWVITSASGSYALTGTDATLVKSVSAAKSIIAGVGSYALTGTDATLLKTTVSNQNQSTRGGGGAPIWSEVSWFRKKKPKKEEIVAEVAATVEQAVPQVTHDESRLVALRLIQNIGLVQLQQLASLDAFIARVEAELAEMDDEEVLLLAA